MTFWPEVRFSHSLVRSAVYHTATTIQRRQAHFALATACDPELDAVPRALHLAAAAAGPDEEVAAALEAAAEWTASRGGCAAAAALLERAALLTPEEEPRADRHVSTAQAHVLAGAVDQAETLLAEATLRPARSAVDRAGDPADGPDPVPPWAGGRGRIRLGRCGGAARTLDPPAARDTLLSALEATMFAGRAFSAHLLHRIAGTARALPSAGAAPDSVTVLLQGCTTRVTGGPRRPCRRCAGRSRRSSQVGWTPTSPSDDWNWSPSRRPTCSTT